MIRFARSLLLLLGLATLPACAAHERPTESSPQVTASAAPVSALAPSGKITTTRTVVVHFDSSSDEIRAGAMQILYGAALDLHGAKVTRIRVTGHTDGAGHRAYNQKLSERRAAAVAAQLGKLGVRTESMTVSGAGEAKDSPRRSKNDRRVEIVIEQIQETVAALPAPVRENTIAVASAMPPHPAAALFAGQQGNIPADTPAVSLSRSPTPLQSAGKQAIKRNLARDGSTWLPPPAS